MLTLVRAVCSDMEHTAFVFIRNLILLPLFMCWNATAFAQTAVESNSNLKGTFYAYWGYNHAWFSKSDIQFVGKEYDFTLFDVVGKDRQTPFRSNVYLNLGKFTIPQYNFRIGYFVNEKYNVSLGIDHMKYVLQNDQLATITGSIDGSDTLYDGVYESETISITKDFLQFEHTDGLNYVNVELRRIDHLFEYKKLKVDLTEGVGLGVLLPKTNTTLLHNERYDKVHLSGYGLNAVVGLKTTFFQHFFLQTELKGGFLNLPNIRTTPSKTDSAKQQFFFVQWNFTLGANVSF